MARLQVVPIDAALVSAASGCDRVISEDLSHGARYGSITVEDPFL